MKHSFLFIITTIITLGLFAQSKPIDVTVIQGDGYTYIKETRKSRLVDLYNQENEYRNVPMDYKNPEDESDSDSSKKLVEKDNWSGLRAELIVNQSFTVQ
ncbi:MAG: DUF5043 domain-containing protein [Bacteroidaceae bacterium]|nr:DUF5043 domain-containing protein [Bacteroidaceae bacterium]